MDLLDWRARALAAALDEDQDEMGNILGDVGPGLLEELAQAAGILRAACIDEIERWRD